jgi:phosphatidate phosphatase LPIN
VEEASLTASIYLVDENQPLIISDIDGTITKEDVLGQLYPMIGKSFLHPGILPFYEALAKRGYQIIYLTARSLGQTKTTQEQLT